MEENVHEKKNYRPFSKIFLLTYANHLRASYLLSLCNMVGIINFDFSELVGGCKLKKCF